MFLLSSLQAFQKLQDYTLLPTACSEASKLGASLSSLCLLINRKHTHFWKHTSNHQYVTQRLPARVYGGVKGDLWNWPHHRSKVLFISSRKTMTHSICMRIWSNCNICRLNFCSKRADSWHHYPPPSLPAPTVQHIGFHTKLLMYNPLNHLTVASHCFETTAFPVSANHHWASKSFSEIDSNVKSGLTDGVGTRVSPS